MRFIHVDFLQKEKFPLKFSLILMRCSKKVLQLSLNKTNVFRFQMYENGYIFAYYIQYAFYTHFRHDAKTIYLHFLTPTRAHLKARVH